MGQIEKNMKLKIKNFCNKIFYLTIYNISRKD